MDPSAHYEFLPEGEFEVKSGSFGVFVPMWDTRLSRLVGVKIPKRGKLENELRGYRYISSASPNTAIAQVYEVPDWPAAKFKGIKELNSFDTPIDAAPTPLWPDANAPCDQAKDGAGETTFKGIKDLKSFDGPSDADPTALWPDANAPCEQPKNGAGEATESPRAQDSHLGNARQLPKAESIVTVIIMEYVQGETLDEKLSSLPTHQKIAILERVLADILRALAHLHKERLRYGDLRPRNIMIQPDGSCKLIDFSTVCPYDEKREDIQYDLKLDVHSPEMIAGNPLRADSRKWDVSADLYSLGLVLWDLMREYNLADRSIPIPSQRGNPVAFDRPSFENRGFSDYYLHTMETLLAPEPAARLAAILPPPAEPATAAPRASSGRRFPPLVWAAGIAGVLGLIIVLAVASPKKTDPPVSNVSPPKAVSKPRGPLGTPAEVLESLIESRDQ